MDKKETMLNELYKNAVMGGDSLVNLIDKVKNPSLRAEMRSEHERYREFSERAADLLSDYGLKPKEPSISAKLGSKVGMAFNTMLDTTSSHIAEMMINGATMGIINIEKQLNHVNPSGKIKDLATDMVDFEKSTADNLARFL